jgi:hypothetical protein
LGCSAYLLPWYFGVIDVLMEEGLYVPAVTPSGGLSGGAYTVMVGFLILLYKV